MKGLADRIPNLELRGKKERRQPGECLYFKKNGQVFHCPFMTPSVANEYPHARITSSANEQEVHEVTS
jgi:hypothetical protein